jgi:diamine N-acetyltransferase
VIRRAQPDDARCLAALGLHVWLDTYAGAGLTDVLAEEALTEFAVDAVRARLTEPGRLTFVAEGEAGAIGFAELLQDCACDQLLPAPQAKLARLYVQPGSQSRGVGVQLLTAATAAAAAHGVKTLWLTAWAGNHGALRFYAREGFRDVGATVHVAGGVSYDNRILVRDVIAVTTP